MNETLISFETAQLAKEKGFYLTHHLVWSKSENIVEFYNDSGRLCCYKDHSPDCCNPNREYSEIPASTQALLQKWLREAHQLYIEVQVQDSVETPKFYWNLFGSYKDNKMIRCIANGSREDHTSYEEALEDGLVTVLNTLPDIKK